MKRNATAVWNGSGELGSGTLNSASKILDQTPYSWRTRFKDDEGTSPEELIAAAHAGCFSMKLSFVLGGAGYVADFIETTSIVEIDEGKITTSHLLVKAKVPGISPEKFQECAEDAKNNCPVSKALRVNISVEASLV